MIYYPAYAAAVRQGGGWIAMAHPFREEPYIDPTIQDVYKRQPLSLTWRSKTPLLTPAEHRADALPLLQENGRPTGCLLSLIHI